MFPTSADLLTTLWNLRPLRHHNFQNRALSAKSILRKINYCILHQYLLNKNLSKYFQDIYILHLLTDEPWEGSQEFEQFTVAMYYIYLLTGNVLQQVIPKLDLRIHHGLEVYEEVISILM